MKNVNLVLIYLFSALAACTKACARTRDLVKRAIAKFLDMVPA